jgi:1-acyl-sn-glycerol-3-phosphate acyltransferase
VFYSILKSYARLAIKVYCIRIRINQPEVLKWKGPLLLAANHPNSFLDGMIMTTLFEQPVYSLARGDAFKHKRMDRFLRSLQLLPVYRTSEGVQNLEHNYTTFAACRATFEKNGIVLIFSEGRCENEWHLRPLKKGTARLAITSWEQAIPLVVLPLAFNYSSFKNFGKEVHIDFGTPLRREEIIPEDSEGKRFLAFNQQLENQLRNMVYEIEPGDEKTRSEKFPTAFDLTAWLLLLPALAGWLIHAPLYYSCKIYCSLKFRHSGHYDSVQTSLLILLYPFYWLACCLVAWSVFSWAALLFMLLLPITAWAAARLKYVLGW